MKLFKSTKLTKIALAGTVLMTLLSGCEYDVVQPEVVPPITTELKFSSDIIPIFDASCNMSGCHAAGAAAPDLSPVNAYTSIMAISGMVDTSSPANSLLYTAMATGSMKSFSTPTQAATVLAWIEQGAKNN